MVEPTLFEPEIEGLLREIAADRRSTLLRVDRPTVVRGLFDRGLPIRAHATGLTSTERHLLQVHRAGMAFMLRQACVTKLFAHPEAKFRLIRNVAPGVRVEAPPLNHLRRSFGRSLRIAHVDGFGLEGIDLLQGCVSADGIARATVGQLAAASMRLEPTDQARIYSAVALMFDGDDRAAVDLFHRVVDSTSSRRMQACAWTEIGNLRCATSQLEDAADAFGYATQLDRNWMPGVCSSFLLAMQLGRVPEAERAAVAVSDCAETNRSGLREFVSLARSVATIARFDKRRVVWVARNLAQRLPLASRELTNAIC